jgi:effector-binding domain-containing protein
MAYEISIVELPEQDVAVVSGHVAVDGIGEFLGGAFGEIMGALDGVQIVGPPFARYAMPDEGFDVMAGFPVSGPVAPSGRVEADRLPGGPAATTMHVGSYEAVAAAFEAVQAWVAENGYVVSGDPWESYLDEPDVPEPRTLVTFPVRRA